MSPVNNSQNDTKYLLPVYSRTKKAKTEGIDLLRCDPDIHLTDVNNFQHIVTPEYQRGGSHTRNYVKDSKGTPLQKPVGTPLNITPEYLRILGQDCPALTWLKN